MKRFAPSAMALSLVLISGCGGDFGGAISSSHALHEDFHQSFAQAPATLSVRTIAGSVDVEAWNKPSAQVDAVKYGGDSSDLSSTHIDTSASGDTLEVHTRYDTQGLVRTHGGEVEYTIHVPVATSVHIVSVAGPVTIAHVHGALDVTSVAGRVQASDADGDVTAKTTAGALDVTMASMPSTRSVDLSSISGDIDLIVPKNADASVSASSISGDFNSTFPINREKQDVGTKASGIIGSGEGRIRLGTISGSISLHS